MSKWRIEKQFFQEDDPVAEFHVAIEYEVMPGDQERKTGNKRLALYDDADPFLVFGYWTPEMEDLDAKTWNLIGRVFQAESRQVYNHAIAEGQRQGEQTIVDQVHRLLGVDRIVIQLATGLGEQY